jgi:hypothetical protein
MYLSSSCASQKNSNCPPTHHSADGFSSCRQIFCASFTQCKLICQGLSCKSSECQRWKPRFDLRPSAWQIRFGQSGIGASLSLSTFGHPLSVSLLHLSTLNLSTTFLRRTSGRGLWIFKHSNAPPNILNYCAWSVNNKVTVKSPYRPLHTIQLTVRTDSVNVPVR